MLNKYKNIGVIGAGTMGIGIAEVAASVGHKVMLFDMNVGFANKAKAIMSKRLAFRVQRGKITQEHSQQIVNNIVIVDDISKLTDSQLVIEAIIENIEIKQKLFQQLQSLCIKGTLFASNTSSISITAIASTLENPENMIGLHFFNPAPVMRLVEVIAGLRSSQENLDTGVDLCKFWNKVPVLAQSSPGFIVNRVARPFYGEALKMLQEQVAAPEVIDAVMTSAGFRMGPFTLMDLIGIDINLAVSQTVFKSMYYDPRYRPSLIQQEMVSANLLGKKTGKGFYKYDGSEKPQVAYADKGSDNNLINFDSLLKNLQKNKTIGYENCSIMMSNGQTCSQRIKTQKHNSICHVDLVVDFEKCTTVNICFDKSCPQGIINKVIALFQLHGKQVIVGNDLPAQIAMRTVCMLINEAADAIENGVCSQVDVDLAMQKGVNYPIGLIVWAHKIGIAHVVSTLDNLHEWFGDDRYRVSPWLRKQL